MSAHTSHIAEFSIFTAVSFLFSYIESLFPLPIPFPGIKLGLANLVILIVLCRLGLRAAFAVSMTRNILNAFTFGSLFGLYYSFAGSILSLLIMAGLFLPKHHPANEPASRRNTLSTKKCLRLSLISISAAGGIAHNIGQFFAAALLVGLEAIKGYLPFLYFSGLIAGILIGIFTNLCLKRLPTPQPSSDSSLY